MRKILLAGAFAVLAAPAFAGIAAGDVNYNNTTATSGAGIVSSQGTSSDSYARNGWTVGGAVSGNYTTVNSNAQAASSPAGSATSANTSQLNVGGTITGGISNGRSSSTQSSGAQQSTVIAGSAAKATNTNLGGFVFTHH